MGFGQRFKVATRAQLRQMSTPPSGASPEAIWHQFFDTQTFPAAGVGTLTFFATANADLTLSNMETGGQLSDPQWLSIYDITADILTADTIETGVATTPAGQLNDHSILLKTNRPTWTLTISDKNYGPYSLTVLHGTGGPAGGNSAGGTLNAQFANNMPTPGWNYKGSLIIPPKTSFRIVVNFGVAGAVSVDQPIRLSLFGILSRRVV